MRVNLQLNRKPEKIAGIHWPGEADSGYGGKRNPPVLSLKKGFQHRSQAGIGVRDPLECAARRCSFRSVFKVPGNITGLSQRLLSGCIRRVCVAFALKAQGFQLQRQPFRSCFRQNRRAPTRENFGPKAFTLNQIPVNIGFGGNGLVHPGAGLKLDKRLFPPAQEAEKIKTEPTVGHVARFYPDKALNAP